ncbi:nuclear transport factor 2 family protein [Actinacidiphila glaucinigra]|uniref:nuclear transport factor 2 family protein n=1 Tax=Actinacidiphila glaucinigra TaxID=235986 RepID=UPI0033E93BC7
MESAKVVEELWQRIQARDWAGAGELITEDAVVEWPVSGERIVGRANFLAVNSEYPEGWSVRVLKIVGEGDQAVSEVEVPHVDLGLFHAASFWTVRDGRIVAGREYWTSPGSDPRPEWRARYIEPM